MSDALINKLVAAARPRVQEALARAYAHAEKELPVLSKLLEELGVPPEANPATPPRPAKERGRGLLNQLSEPALYDIAVVLVQAIADATTAPTWEVTEQAMARLVTGIDGPGVASEIGLEPATLRLALDAMRRELQN